MRRVRQATQWTSLIFSFLKRKYEDAGKSIQWNLE